MKRDINSLANGVYDLVIIGGGIYGATAAWEASLRGLRVALIEKDDFGSATSSNSLKIVHGGLRYIQHLDYKRMRESIRERRLLMKLAPHLVHPLPVVMPTYGHLGKGPEVLRVALWINDLVGYDRNRLEDPQKHLPAGRILSKDECLQLVPGIREENLTGGALWYDAHMYNSERLLLAFLHSAARMGARLANYVEARSLRFRGNRVVGVEVTDRLSGMTFVIQGRMVLGTMGPWSNVLLRWLRPHAKREAVEWSWAMNLVTRKLPPKVAAGILGKHKVWENGHLVDYASKVYFTLPWREYSLIGTLHAPFHGDPNEFRVRAREIHRFLIAFNEAYPAAQLKEDDVYFFHGGLLPMDRPNPKSGEVVLTKHYKIIDHSREDGIEGTVSVVGVKYTTARDVASKAVSVVMAKLGKASVSVQTEQLRLAGGDIARFEEFEKEATEKNRRLIPEKVIKQLVRNYGTEYLRILDYGKENLHWLKPFKGSSVLPAEVIHAVREEMAVHLEDVIRRRTELGSGQLPPDEVLRQVAELMGKELDWSGEKIREEISRVKERYRPAMD